ncbi:hypothetical protein PR048_019153 [Dryococelus australis]|uniref:Peptidase A2 domain-containing protein n=1 Tax=Dryococelus australis TaxID=614101 RepID=A0ABQ9H2S6_9NEOP|nr:hypothetical protein PR048_019153 [Dryococelus australis]
MRRKEGCNCELTTCILAPPASFNFRRPKEWGSRFKRFQGYRLVSGLLEKSDKMHVSTLIYILGQEAEDIMNSFNPSDKESASYEAVVKRFESHFVLKRNVIYESVKFNLRSQLADESADTFVMALHSLAKKYEYKSMRNELIRDRLVVELLDKRLSKMLQLDANLTLETAVNKARQTEAVIKQQLIVQKLNRDQPVEENIDRISLQLMGRKSVHPGGQVIPFKIDMGADVTVVPEQVFGSRYSASNLEIKLVNTQLFGPCSSLLKIQGKIATPITWQGNTVMVDVYAVQGLKEPLLGRSAIESLEMLQWVEDLNQLSNKFDQRVRYPKLFEGLGLMAATYTIRLKNETVPVSLHAPCRMALPLQLKLKQEIDRLVNMIIISPVDRPTEWCSGICTFGTDGVKFLGHVISSEGVEADPAKIEAIRDMPQPQSITDRECGDQLSMHRDHSLYQRKNTRKLRDILLITDHQPLVSILENKNIDELPPRLQRYRMWLMKYTYQVKHISGKNFFTPDALSRAPVKGTGKSDRLAVDEIEEYATQFMRQFPASDGVKEAGLGGLASDTRTGSTIVSGILAELWGIISSRRYINEGNHMLIPARLWKDIMDRIHLGHLGIKKCTERARKKTNRPEPLLPSPLSQVPWEVVGMDLAEQDGTHYLVIIEYYSWYPEIFQLPDTKTSTTISRSEVEVHRSYCLSSHGQIIRKNKYHLNPVQGEEEDEQQGYNWGESYPLEGEKPTVRTMPRENIAAALEEEEDLVQWRSLSSEMVDRQRREEEEWKGWPNLPAAQEKGS